MSKNNKNDNMNTPKKHLMLSAARHRNQKKTNESNHIVQTIYRILMKKNNNSTRFNNRQE